MKKFIYAVVVTFAFLGYATIGRAQSDKVITLKDGSVLKGKIIELKDGVYTIQTKNLGQVQITESDILSTAVATAATAQQQSSDSHTSAQKDSFKDQVGQMQGTLMGDPEIMAEIETLVNNEEIKAMLSDPALLNDIMSMDQNKIINNTNVRDLMNNPEVQKLMQKIQQKMPPQP